MHSFDVRCAQHAKDVAALVQLADIVAAGVEPFAVERDRVIAASRRSPQAFTAP